ncbi:MAG TPA: cytochrome c [Thermoanaerobaculia bacterium]|nr:cytochrome c [Thermoanaerobaculia bacterium]
MKYFAGIVLGVILIVAGAAAFVGAGLFNPAASVPPSGLETRVARFALDRSVARRASRAANPLPANAEVLEEGRRHYKEMCVTCHGAPGVDASEAGEGLNPPATDLTLGRVQQRSDGELFWIVQNGIRMTGMPAFGPTHKDRQIWAIVAFVRHLPAMTPEETKAMKPARGSGD